MSRSTLDDYGEIAYVLGPAAVSQFLAAHNWELEQRQVNVREIWRYSAGNRDTTARVMLPLATDFADFTPRFADALESLGHIHDWDAAELLERVIATRADLFFVRLDQAMIDGTIPFQQADRTIQAIYKMMRAAATTTADPQHSHRGRRPAAVNHFLDEDVRLGHTKRGSFVFTILTRLGDPSPPAHDADVTPMAFPRRAMETLARGLEITEHLALAWDQAALEPPGQLSLSAGLVEAIEDMSKPDHLRSLDFSFEWAAGERRPNVGLVPVTLDRDAIAALPRVRERLAREEDPVRRETLVGLVESLTREGSMPSGEEAALVVLSAEVNGKSVRVHVQLLGEAHNWAIMAYQRELPLTVTGNLVYERRTWRLTGEIEVDSQYLRRLADSDSPDVGPGRGEALS